MGQQDDGKIRERGEGGRGTERDGGGADGHGERGQLRREKMGRGGLKAGWAMTQVGSLFLPRYGRWRGWGAYLWRKVGGEHLEREEHASHLHRTGMDYDLEAGVRAGEPSLAAGVRAGEPSLAAGVRAGEPSLAAGVRAGEPR